MINVTKLDTFAGHRDAVYALIPAEEKGCFYSAGADGLVVRWDLSKPDLGKLVARAGSSVYALAMDTRAGNLWIGQNYEGVQLVKPVQNEAVSSVKLTSAAIFDIRLRGQEAYLAFGDGVVGIMDIEAMAMKRHIRMSDKSVRALDFSRDGAHLAVGGSDDTVRIFDSASMTPIHTLSGHTKSVFTVAYSPDGNFLITAGRDAHFKVWDIRNDYRLVEDVVGHMYAINHIAFSPDGALFATCSMDKSIKLWDAASFKLLKVIDRSRHAGHGTSVNKLLWTGEPGYLLSASDDRMISVWEVAY